jgi:ABC-2 type transport system permease protein
MWNLLYELVRKDLRIFIADRRSVIISFAIPTVLACFIGYLYTQTSSPDSHKVSIMMVDQDHSEFSKALLDKLKESPDLDVSVTNEARAIDKVRHGDMPLAIVIPKDFGKQAASAMTAHTAAPEYRILADPTRAIQTGMAQGALMRTTMQVLPKIVFGAMAPSNDDMPFKVKSEFQSTAKTPNTSMSAHAFAGMGIQGLLFWAIESAMTILVERRQGIWRRLRASPVAPWMFVLGKAVSATIRAMAILFFVFAAGALLFHFQIRPAWECYLGFALIAFAVSVMTASFGLFVASLGKNAQQSRGLSTLAVLGMCMLGGAWFPMELLPKFMQTLSKVIPITWAINGFDDMIWRGGGLRDALTAVAVLLGFSVFFVVVALKRITWEPEAG